MERLGELCVELCVELPKWKVEVLLEAPVRAEELKLFTAPSEANTRV